MTEISLHLPRKRKPILTVGRIYLLMLIGVLGFWWGVISLVRHLWR